MSRDSGVEVFDFFGSLADEYIRSCKVNPERGDNTWFYNCDDYIHTGFLVVHYSTQILLNRLCNQM